MTRKRTRNLSWTPGNGPGCREVLGAGQVLLPLTDVDDTTRPHLLVMNPDDAEFLGNQLVGIARIARDLAV